jgi:hypothetical protein
MMQSCLLSQTSLITSFETACFNSGGGKFSAAFADAHETMSFVPRPPSYSIASLAEEEPGGKYLKTSC